MKISIITPFYNESEGIEMFFNTIVPILVDLGKKYEIVCIDDGSKDDTFSKLELAREKNENIKCVKLSRNFGKEAALTAGLDYTTGDVVIPMDCDLQDPPSLLGQMIDKWDEGYMVVLARRSSRNEGLVKSLTAKLFYQIINSIADSPIPKDVGDFRLMDKKVVNSIKNLKEKTRFMKGLLSWPGYNSCVIEYDRPERSVGVAKQNYLKLFKLAFDGILSFSEAPLRFIVWFGFLITFFAFVYLLFIVVRPLFIGLDVPGYSSTIAFILFLGGMNIFFVGVIGLYISKIFKETKERPIFIVEKELL